MAGVILPDSIIRQGDDRWRHMPLPGGARGVTYGTHGCLLMCLTMLARHHHQDKTMTPPEVAQRVSLAGGFYNGRLILSTAARAVHLRHTCEGPFDEDRAEQELTEGRPIIAGLDYKAGSSSRLSDADHFVVVVGVDAGWVTYADPATGMLGAMATGGGVYKGRKARLSEMRCFAYDPPKTEPRGAS